MQKPIRKIAPLWSIVVCLLAAMAALADPARVTNIPPQELAPALQSLARDRGFQIVFVSEEISGRRTRGAAGNLTLEEALARLLEGTGLTFKYLDEKTVTIVPAPQAASVAPPAPAAVKPPDLQPTELPEVTVEGQRQALERRLSQFVATITREPGTYDSLTRWHGRICPAVAGLAQDRGDFVLERISTIARAAGAPLAPQKCEPNLFVLFSPDPTRLVKDMASHNAGRFMGLSGQRADGAAVRKFAESTQPVRAWYNTQLRGAMGNELRGFDEAELGGRRPLQNDHPMMSRIQHDDVQELVSVLVIVDTRRIDGVKIGAVADYAAMLGLTRINLDADVTGDDSILRLFSLSADAAATLSRIGTWDAAFLKALYGTDQGNKMQRQSIVNYMMRDTTVSPQ